MRSQKKLSNAYYISIGAISIFVASYNIAIISVALKPIERAFNVSSGIVYLLGALIFVGAMIGAVVSGVFSDRFGRVSILAIDIVTFLLAGIGSALSTNIAMLMFFRTLVGVGVGIDYVVIFTYISEIVAGKNSTRNLALIMFFANFGILFSYLIGGSLLTLGPTGWRYALLSGALFSIVPLIMRAGIKESSLWKFKRIKSMKAIIKDVTSRGNRKYLYRFSVPWFLYQIGDQSLTMFLPFILITALGVSAVSGAFSAVIVKAFTIPASILAFLIIQRLGTRKLQAAGFIIRSVFLGILGFGIYFALRMPGIEIIILLGLAFFFGSMGPDKTTVIMPVENYDESIRASGQGFNEMAGRFGGLIGILAFSLFGLAGIDIGLIFLSITCILGFFFTIAYRDKQHTEKISKKANEID
ncbi:MAG: MFS transporter [Ferroplasma sp.]|uniref:MFS transporter n=1 Tax=Ferroplasma sp. TaxID=2591003 RepID=UPI002814BC5A|nr:MFS transporter [Ferroplasma sp.]WMT51785.1 MAG: MFS transporter [Ferroplasma sp.]